MPDVFVSYSRQDKAFANQIVNALEKDRRDVWVDWQDIPRGEDWLNEIKSGIENTDTFILIVSQNSLRSEICNYEVRHARDQNKRLIPIILQDIDNEREAQLRDVWAGENWGPIASENWTALRHINWIFARHDDGFDEMFAELINAVDTDPAHLKAHTRYQVRALDWYRAGENPSFLLTGDEIAAAEHWQSVADAEAKDPPPTALHRRYIRAARATEDARTERLRQIERRTRAFQVSSVVLVLTIILGAVGAYLIVGSAQQQVDLAQGRVTQANEAVLIARSSLTPIPVTLTAVQGTAAAEIAGANAEVNAARSALTPIPVTLTAVQGTAAAEIANANVQSTRASERVAGAEATLTQIPVTVTAVSEELVQLESVRDELELELAALEEDLLVASDNILNLLRGQEGTSVSFANYARIYEIEYILRQLNPDYCPQLSSDLFLDLIETSINLELAKCDLVRNSICALNGQIRYVDASGMEQTLQHGTEMEVVALQEVLLSEASGRNIDTWGIIGLSLQTNLPDTLPGQSVPIFLLGPLGDVPQQVFAYGSSVNGLDNRATECDTSFSDGLLVQTPQGVLIVEFLDGTVATFSFDP